MTRSAPAQRSFASGEISRLLAGRPDYLRYQTGLDLCRGFIPLREGPVTRAPGTRHLGRTHADAQARLIPFAFNDDDAVVLEFSDLRMRVWRYGALVMDGASPFELATPWSYAAVRRLQWAQSADVIYLCDGAAPPRKLSRLALDSWTLTEFTPNDGPFRPMNVGATTVQASAATGSVTLTASAALFTALHVGGLIELRVRDWDATPLWTGNTAVLAGDRMRYAGQVYEAVADGDTGVNPPVHREGDALSQKGGLVWRWVGTDRGVARITAVASGTFATATVLTPIPAEIVADPTPLWSEGAWSALHGWPAAVTLHENRLWFAATTSDPATVWASAIGAFDRFGLDGPADGFAYAVDGGRTLNRVVWLAGGQQGLHVATQGDMLTARSSARLEALTSETFRLSFDASIGAHRRPPVAPDGRPIFISRDRRRIHEMRYRLDTDAVSSVELSLAASHLGADRFEEIAWQSAPLRLAWIVRASGDLAVLVHDPDEEVLGWATLPVAGGVVESVAVTPGLDGDDEVHLVVRRQIGGETRRHVERLSPFFGVVTGEITVARAEHLYACHVREFDPPVAVIDGLDHLEGEDVFAWTPQGQFGPLTVQGGEITLHEAVPRAVVGLLDGTHRLRTLDLFVQARDGDSTGRRVTIRKLGLRLHRSGGLRVRTRGRRFGAVDVVERWQTVSGAAVPGDIVAGFSGVVSVNAPTGWEYGVAVEIEPLDAAPLTLAAITPEVEGRA